MVVWQEQCNMWHSNSRQWLVTDKENRQLKYNNATIKRIERNLVSNSFSNNNTNKKVNYRRHQRHDDHEHHHGDEDTLMQCMKKTNNKFKRNRHKKWLSDLSGIGQMLTTTSIPAITSTNNEFVVLNNNKKNINSQKKIKRPKSHTHAVKQVYQFLLNQKIVVLLLAILLAQGRWQPLRAISAYDINNQIDDIDVAHIWQRQQRLNSLNGNSLQQNFKISPKPCSIGGIDGTCMFVWECIKSEGRHVGMCVDAFMFGSCCVHNYTDNIVMPPSFSYTRPTKPLYTGHNQQQQQQQIQQHQQQHQHQQHHKPRPPPFASHYRPPAVSGISGMTTIERPHGAGTLVIRPSGPHHQRPYGSLQRPRTTTSTTTTTTTTPRPIITTTTTPATTIHDMQTAASLNTWSTFGHHTTLPNNHIIKTPATTTTAKTMTAGASVLQHYWQMTTEPNFITKPRPPSLTWDKPSLPLRPKPTKTTTTSQPSSTSSTSPSSSSTFLYATKKRPTTTTTTTVLPKTTPITTTTEIIKFTESTRPKPQIIPEYSMKPAPTTTRPMMRPPTPAWITSESAFSHDHSNSFSFSSTSFKPTTTTTTTTQLPTTTTTTKRSTTTTTTTTKITTEKSTTASTTISSSTMSTSMQPTAVNNFTAVLPLVQNYSNVEINEIADTSNSDGIIKLISAARSDCGVPTLTRPETRIVGGKSSVFGHWPWQVSVRRTTFFGFSSTHRCGGALINENWIATAGHCVDDLLISQIRIRVGEYDFSHVQEQLQYIERGVVKKVVHPKYNFYTYEYDLALVKLESPLDFAPHVSPICLPQTESLLIGMNATVTGWGRLSEGGTLPSVLQEAAVPIVSNDNCKSMFLRAGRLEIIPEIFLCAGYETGGQDSCQGDSGGPLQVKAQDGRYFLAGIISWGIGCAEANLPGVCTRISKFVPWIMENVT